MSQHNLQAQLKTAQADTRPKFLIACKANAPRQIVLKNLPTLKKIKNADTQAGRK